MPLNDNNHSVNNQLHPVQLYPQSINYLHQLNSTTPHNYYTTPTQ
jgi:hypothetical protein